MHLKLVYQVYAINNAYVYRHIYHQVTLRHKIVFFVFTRENSLMILARRVLFVIYSLIFRTSRSLRLKREPENKKTILVNFVL